MNIHIDKLPSRFPDRSFIVMDIELFNMELHRLHRPHGKFACLSITPVDHTGVVEPEDVYLVTDEKIVDIAVGRFDNCILVFHNASFDITQIRRFTDLKPQNIWDTMIIEKLLWSGYYDQFALKDLARRYCNILMDKDPVKKFATATELTEELIQYSATDGIVNAKVLQEQYQEVKKRPDVFKIWKDVDMPAVWAFSEFSGFRIDKDMWLSMAEKNKTKAEELKDTFDFLPSSWQQVKAELLKTGFKGLPSTGEKVLLQWIYKKPNTEAAQIARDVLDYRKIAKLSSTYGKSWVKFMEEEDDYYVIHANHKPTWAETGRTAVDNPALHNVPIRNNPEFRTPFIAKPGHSLLVGDWTAQEPYLHAHYSKDKRLLEIINSGEDIYCETSRIFGKPIEKSDPYRNERMKPTYLGSIYGLTPKGMSERYNVPIEECEELQSLFRSSFPESANWCDRQRQENSYVETIMGRRFWLNPCHRQKEENALNQPHQGGGADILKIALGNLLKGWDWACPFGAVHQNHDEIIADVPKKYAKDAAHFMQETMEAAGTDMVDGLIKFKAKVTVCNNWLEGK